MADFNVNLTSSEGATLPVDGFGKSFVLKRTVDFTDTDNQLAQNAIMALFHIPAYVKVREVLMRVTTADTDITTVELGGYSRSGTTITEIDLDGFGVNATLAATGYVAMDVDAVYNPAGTGGRGYVATSDWYVTVKNTDANTLDEAVVEFIAICEDLR